MKKIIIALAALMLTLSSCTNDNNQDMQNNPFFTESTLPHGAFPFDQLQTEHYLPAIKAGIQQQQEIDAIVNNPEEPTFENTIVALENTGRMLNRVCSIFYNLLECNGTDEMHKISEEAQPLVSEHSLNVSLNEPLFARIQQVWEKSTVNGQQSPDCPLNTEQFRLLKETYDGYLRSGATLQGADRERWRAINTELDSLTLAFGQNVQKATAAWTYQLNPETDLAGLPGFVTEALKQKRL